MRLNHLCNYNVTFSFWQIFYIQGRICEEKVVQESSYITEIYLYIEHIKEQNLLLCAQTQ